MGQPGQGRNKVLGGGRRSGNKSGARDEGSRKEFNKGSNEVGAGAETES